MTSYFDIELEKLNNAIVKIASLAENQLGDAVNTLLLESKTAGKTLRKKEDKIDKLDVKIDEICQRIFALQQPVASDLRFIMASLQISNEIERIGDLALSIVKSAKNIKDKHDLVKRFDIAGISRQVEVVNQKTNEITVIEYDNIDDLDKKMKFYYDFRFCISARPWRSMEKAGLLY